MSLSVKKKKKNFFSSCLDCHSDGTHSLLRIHWWASDVMLNAEFLHICSDEEKLIYILDGLSIFSFLGEFQPRLIGNTCLYIHFCNTVIMYLAARFVAVSKWNVQRVALKHTFNTWPWHVFITLVQARIAVFSLCCLRYVLPPFIIQISGECR